MMALLFIGEVKFAAAMLMVLLPIRTLLGLLFHSLFCFLFATPLLIIDALFLKRGKLFLMLQFLCHLSRYENNVYIANGP